MLIYTQTANLKAYKHTNNQIIYIPEEINGFNRHSITSLSFLVLLIPIILLIIDKNQIQELMQEIRRFLAIPDQRIFDLFLLSMIIITLFIVVRHNYEMQIATYIKNQCQKKMYEINKPPILYNSNGVKRLQYIHLFILMLGMIVTFIYQTYQDSEILQKLDKFTLIFILSVYGVVFLYFLARKLPKISFLLGGLLFVSMLIFITSAIHELHNVLIANIISLSLSIYIVIYLKQYNNALIHTFDKLVHYSLQNYISQSISFVLLTILTMSLVLIYCLKTYDTSKISNIMNVLQYTCFISYILLFISLFFRIRINKKLSNTIKTFKQVVDQDEV